MAINYVFENTTFKRVRVEVSFDKELYLDDLYLYGYEELIDKVNVFVDDMEMGNSSEIIVIKQEIILLTHYLNKEYKKLNYVLHGELGVYDFLGIPVVDENIIKSENVIDDSYYYTINIIDFCVDGLKLPYGEKFEFLNKTLNTYLFDCICLPFYQKVTTEDELNKVVSVFENESGGAIIIPSSCDGNVYAAKPDTDIIKNDSLVIYTDGGYSSGKRVGGWAYVVQNEAYRVVSGHAFNTTNNVMEMTAVLEALKYANSIGAKAKIYSDSKYVVQGLTEWIHNWKVKNWKTSSKKDVLNKELWVCLYNEFYKNGSETSDHTIEWVKGHSNCQGNNLADKACTREIESN